MVKFLVPALNLDILSSKIWNIPLGADMFQYFSIFVRFDCTDKEVSVKLWQFRCLPFVMVSVHEVFLTLKAKKKQLAVLLWVYHEPGQRQPQKKTFLKLSDYSFDRRSRCCLEGWKPFIISNRTVVACVLCFMHFIHYPKSTKMCKNRNINVVNHLDMWLLFISYHRPH